MQFLTRWAIDRPQAVVAATVIFSVVMGAVVAVPTLAPGVVPLLRPLVVDTDPENMLADDEPVRVFHDARKAEFGLHDFIVVGVVQGDDRSGAGVFNTRTLANVHELATLAGKLHWADGEAVRGVVGIDVIAPSTVDAIEQAGPGAVSFSWLMPEPPRSDADALAVRDRAARIPTLNGTLVSGDGRAIALYIPVTSKDVSYRVASELRAAIARFDDGAEYHITGLPIAQDQFGVEMFRQMAISAPAAMLLIFVLMWVFFRRVRLIVSPMIVAVVSVTGAMGALIASGQTVHIMSSMIPIFVMPIAVLDAVHLLSEFHDRYPALGDRRKALHAAMRELWRPMLFTTLTTTAGFASLALTPIPPVQVFGIFVAVGVALAWVLTVTLIPAAVMLLPDRALQGFGLTTDKGGGHPGDMTDRLLRGVGRLATVRPGLILGLSAAGVAVSLYGISRIQINDNPVKWFAPGHEIRVADRVLNDRFAGTYLAYLVLEAGEEPDVPGPVAARLSESLGALGTPAARTAAARLEAARRGAASGAALVSEATAWAYGEQEGAPGEDWLDWDDVIATLESASGPAEVFKQPDVLRFVERLQAHLVSTGLVGKSNALPDVVKTVHRDLQLGSEDAYRIPDSREAVAQTLIAYESSHRPHDLYKMVTPDYRKANLWIQLRSGDNSDMNAVVEEVDAFMAASLPPVPLTHAWFGLTYINTVWQAQMVRGMAAAFLGSFLVVLVLMVVLFRSLSWAALSMVPLSGTIAAIYGFIGLTGRPYDMPIAVLSSLSLGLAVDYAIHFNVRAREAFQQTGNWPDTAAVMFGEPARAIFRNVIVIGTGFLPLLLAPLVPYQTVGVFISAILLLAGVSTLFVLPAVLTLLPEAFLKVRSTLSTRHAL